MLSAVLAQVKARGDGYKVKCAGAGALSDNGTTHHKAGTIKFGTASRDAAEKVFISTEHDRSSGGR